jgi:4,5-dihydroxyphthalate decarboxylase
MPVAIDLMNPPPNTETKPRAAADGLELSIALSDNENTKAVLDGSISPDGIRLHPTPLHPSEMFWRQLKFAEFDVSEMSMSSLTIATSKGPTPWVMIPVFTTREFFHLRCLVRVASGIKSPADLKGKRVGVPEYQQTAALWSRGVLQHEFGVHPRDVEWHMERSADMSHGGATAFEPPEGVVVKRIPMSSNIGEMLVKGELDATLLYLTHQNIVDRSRIDLSKDDRFRPLFDRKVEGPRYFAKTGIYQINHGMVIRRSLHERYPWAALNLYNAFAKARAQVIARRDLSLHRHYEPGVIGDDVRKALATDTMAYGVKTNRKVLETITQYVHEQGLSHRRVGLEELFAASTLDL